MACETRLDAGQLICSLFI